MKPNKLFFTSDTHFFHTNIIEYANRPFANVEDMNDEIIRNWNDTVPKDGIIYHLGDFALGNQTETLNILNRLNGQIYLIRGNHEKTVMSKQFLRSKFAGIFDYVCELNVDDPEATYVSGNGKQLIVLSHYAFEVWRNSHHGSWHLHGHSHNTLPTPDDKLRLDVGVDNPLCDFYPISYNRVKEHMKTKKFKPVNHKED